jgi:diguanylate cyclase (GGDEF)-like protein
MRLMRTQHEQLLEEREVCGALHAAALAMSVSSNAGELAEALLEAIEPAIGFEAACVLIVERGRRAVASSRGFEDAGSLLGAELALALNTPHSSHYWFGVEELWVHPIRFEGQLVGGLLLRYPAGPTRLATTVLGGVLPGLGVALSNSLTRQELRRSAATDAMTGSYTLRFGMQRLHEEFDRALRADDPLAVMLFELEFDLLELEDALGGKEAVEGALRELVTRIWRALRTSDLLIRYEGSELLAVLPGASAGDLETVAARVQAMATQSRLQVGGREIGVSMTLGAAALSAGGIQNPGDLIGAADQALQRVKEASLASSLSA